MASYVGASEAPYTHDSGTVCLGDVVELTDDEAARGLASGQLVPAQAPEIAPPQVPETEEVV